MDMTLAREVEASSHVAVGRLNPARVTVVGISADGRTDGWMVGMDR